VGVVAAIINTICAGGSAMTRRKQKKILLWNLPVSDVGFWCVFVFIGCALGQTFAVCRAAAHFCIAFV
jgi:hypothetical protein